MRSVFVDVANELVLVESSLPSAVVQQRLESTGKLVVFRGFGGVGGASPAPSHHCAAVAIMKNSGRVHGLARLVQVHIFKKVCHVVMVTCHTSPVVSREVCH